MEIIVDAFLIIIGVAASYVAFVTIAIALARAIFPKIEIKDVDLAGDGITIVKSNVKKLQSRIISGASRTRTVLSETKRISGASA